MTLIRKRKCPECGGGMEAKLINLHYKRQNIEMEVEVIGIPANVCTRVKKADLRIETSTFNLTKGGFCSSAAASL